jgi:ferrochelatase
MLHDPSPYDAFLLVSFGGPEGPDEVVPFLENVTRGRGIPRERLVEVGQHYFHFGGKSPINDRNREYLAALREDFAGAGIDLPVYWGNRNWAPYLTDVVAEIAAAGHRRVAVFFTSVYSSYSSCRQYRENLADAVGALPEGVTAPEFDVLRRSFNHPGFIEAVVDATLAAVAELPDAEREAAHLAFVTHSIPLAMNDASGPDGGAYVAQHRSVMEEVVERVRLETGHRFRHQLVYCSRSGAPHIPWLEPDINDHLAQLAEQGKPAVVGIPIGFVSDHMEVVWDLDTEAAATAEKLDITWARAATAGVDPRFVATPRELLLERAAAERGAPVASRAEGSLPPCWDRCATGCCANLQQGPRPALGGVGA